MRPITIRFTNPEISDVYCYVGHLFFTTHDGHVYAKSLKLIHTQLALKYPGFESFLKIALINNDWLVNEQFNALICGRTKIAFEAEWNKAAKELFEINLDINECQNIGKTTGIPVYDIKAYALHIFVAHGQGLDVIKIDDDVSNGIKVNYCKKSFDARIIGISAKIGEVLFSGGNDGLFGGSLWQDQFSINEKAIEAVSFKTLWSNWDFNNYLDRRSFNHVINTVVDEKDRKFFYSSNDDDKSKKRIEKIGSEIVSSEQFFGEEEYSYIINSNNYFYIFKKNGEISLVNLLRDRNGKRYISSRKKVIHQKFNEEILSAKTGKDAVVMETFDGLSLMTNRKVQRLSSTPALNYRTYLGSIRFRNSITASFNGYSELYLY